MLSVIGVVALFAAIYAAPWWLMGVFTPGPLLILGFCALGAIGPVRELRRPGVLELTPAGLTLRQHSGTQSWRWRDIGPVRIEKGEDGGQLVFTANRGVALALSTAGTVELPRNWGLPLDDVVATLNAARDRWGRQAEP
ncbi:MAG: hypothetical protein GC203_05220 [Phenylobacterium sp.]|uniref:hypothetical protein n=1 Tax=Phenylobacterium sp. TaxID=1871053 RepID=UPI0025CF99A0|nr:hypothetical protein [Phenylobacterium sp.]MBI1197245.1 hypothetical protein [Phenylobacterium sp.]